MRTPPAPPLFPLAKPVYAAFVPPQLFTVKGGSRNLNRAPIPSEVKFRECVMGIPVHEDIIGHAVARPVVLDLHGYVLAGTMPGFAGYYEMMSAEEVCAQLHADFFPAAA